MPDAPVGLRYEHLDDAVLGAGHERPRLSWRLEGTQPQLAWELETTASGVSWTSGRVNSAECALVTYPGPLPRPGERMTWRVRAWTSSGATGWSEPAWWEPGLRTEDWAASWIVPAEVEFGVPGSRPTHLLRGSFTAGEQVTARLHITAHGVYEAHLNGVRIGDAELTPGYTEYAQRLQVQVYDVTGAIAAGENVLEVELSDGWFRGKVGLFRSVDQWGDSTALLAQLVLTAPDGSTSTWGTGAGWTSRTTPHLADIIDGETIDPTAAESEWMPVAPADRGFAQLVASPAPPVRRHESLAPVSITAHDGAWIVDFGQNLAGWLRIAGLGAVGTHVTLTFAEELDPAGGVTQYNLAPHIPMLPAPLEAGQVDHLVSDGDPARAVETRHSTHGFRYVRIDGLDHEPSPDDLRAVVVHTDLRRTGSFTSSDERVNRFHDAAVWSLRGNAIDIPTDCPVRERAGWTGDWQIYIPTAAYLYDVAGFSLKWLRDLAGGQWENGVIANMAPAPHSEVADGFFADANGSAGWGDAIVIVPWELFQAYGDERVLEEFWPNMVRWIDFVSGVAEAGRHPSRVARSTEPRDHERYLWDTGFHWGEWLEPQVAGDFDFGALMAADKGDTATAFYRRSTQLMARIATVLGLTAEAAKYSALSAKIRDAWRTEFLQPDGTVRPATQANCVRALAFDLVPDRAVVAQQLAELVRANGDHLSTGFLATPDLLPVLAENGQAETAYALLQQDSYPSWLFMVEQGATTVWERWEGWEPSGLPHESHNHFSKGAVISFLHRYVAGIRPVPDAPAYRRFEVKPVLGGGFTHAEGRLETPYGLLESSWHLDGDEFSIRVVVPNGTRCRIVLPDGVTHGALAGTHEFSTRLRR